jgi:hypothetical protein
MYNMVLYLCVLIVFSLRRESLKFILATDPLPRWFYHNLCNISFMGIVVLLNVSFMDTVNDSIMCIISLNCLSVTKSSSSSSRSCCGGYFLGGMVSGIEKR